MIRFCVVFLFFIYNSHSDELPSKPTFTAINPNRISIIVPKYDDSNLIIFRISVRDDHNFEYGENSIDNEIVIYHKNLNLKKGDLINYLIGFRDQFGSYHAQVGTYQFDGTFQHSLNKRSLTESEEASNFDPLQPRFGRGHHHNRRAPPRHLGNPVYPSNPFLNSNQHMSVKPGIALLPHQNYYCNCDNYRIPEHSTKSTDPDIDIRMGQ